MRSLVPFTHGWLFNADYTAATIADQGAVGTAVTLPHTAVELPFSYFDETTYWRPFLYRKSFEFESGWAGKEVSLVFDGAMANSKVFLNGDEIASHQDGYTPFEVRLTGRLKVGSNLISVVLDGSENPRIPPFGGPIDYLTYAGIYREVWLKVVEPVSIGNVKIETPDALATEKTVTVRVTLSNPASAAFSGALVATIRDAAGAVIATVEKAVSSEEMSFSFTGLKGLTLWEPNAPTLYTLDVTFGGDKVIERFGFRTAEFTPEGFKLNGKPLKIRGLNRHQSFPYVGYAMGKSVQERDAEILKHQLHVNLVRTSHYPQSKHFLNRCDELGLLVFEEIPGWQHIGAAEWKAQAVDNVAAMIRRDWNHPSIILWGVRINESQDDHDFYAETNRVARELDSTRQTGGVRYITDSELLEDVYTMNDFILGNEELGGNRPRTALRPQQEVTGKNHNVPYMITEFGGHMYPTKIYDQEQRQAEHVRRHLDVLNAAYGDSSISGAIGWCAFDYNTHKDFGSGDRICHHGVMDMFREPKFAAFAYASQCEPDEDVILAPVTFWARGERNIGGVLPLLILTNCDEVELQYGNYPPKRVGPDREAFPHLPHPPVIVDRRHFSAEELGLWGMRWEAARITGYVDGKAVKTIHYADDPVPVELEVVADAAELDGSKKDSTRVIIRVKDQAGHKLPFLFDPVTISVEGPARLLGPSTVPLRAGATGFWIETTGGAGTVKVTVGLERLGSKTLAFSAN
jgi:beta-galactosidase